MVLEGQRRETPFTVRDNMLDIWNQCTELSFRGFGKKERKSARTPRNFNAWSEESQIKWLETAERKRLQQERWDQMFIENETKIVDGLCRDIVYFIDRANVINPQYICECNKQRLLQDDAIGYCHNLKREFNHIASVIPCNLNFLAIQSERVDYEISLLRKWKQSCNTIRKDILIKEKEKRMG